MRIAVHGMPRIGPERTLKWALESYWAGTMVAGRLDEVGASIRRSNWQSMVAANVDFIPSNEFLFLRSRARRLGHGGCYPDAVYLH